MQEHGIQKSYGPGADTDSFTIEWRDRKGRDLAGLTYSDEEGEIALYLKRPRFASPELLRGLRRHVLLKDLSDLDSGKFWNCAYIPLFRLDETFFSLRADQQLEKLVDRTVELLKAVLVQAEDPGY